MSVAILGARRLSECVFMTAEFVARLTAATAATLQVQPASVSLECAGADSVEVEITAAINEANTSILERPTELLEQIEALSNYTIDTISNISMTQAVVNATQTTQGGEGNTSTTPPASADMGSTIPSQGANLAQGGSGESTQAHILAIAIVVPLLVLIGLVYFLRRWLQARARRDTMARMDAMALFDENGKPTPIKGAVSRAQSPTAAASKSSPQNKETGTPLKGRISLRRDSSTSSRRVSRNESSEDGSFERSPSWLGVYEGATFH